MSETRGQRIDRLIKIGELSQRELAKRLGTSEASVSRYVHDERVPKSTVLAEIADILGTTTDYLERGSAEDTIDPSDENFGEMMIFAERYCLGRKSYAPHDAVDFLRPLLPRLSEHTLKIMRRDISEVIEAQTLGVEFIDVPIWKEFFYDLEKEMQKRNENRMEME